MAKFYYGGQAVIEGVMMRGRFEATTVIRRRDGSLVTRTDQLPDTLYRHRLARIPLIRGLIMLWEMVGLGTRVMLYSANVQAKSELQREIPRRLMILTMSIAACFAVLLFFVLPLLLTRAASHGLSSSFFGNVVEGLIRLSVFLLYLALIGRMDQMDRVFQYHGAEHKTINAFEHGAALEPRTVQGYSTIHVRCGTAFLLWVVVLSVFVFALLGHPPLLIGILARLVLIPLIAAVSYEILRLGARFYRIGIVRAVVTPGLWLQRLTTREPSDEQVEVAIAALAAVLRTDGETALVPISRGEPLEGLRSGARA